MWGKCHYNITGIFLDGNHLSLATSCLSYRADSNTDIEYSAGSSPVNLAGRCDVTGALPQVCEILTGFLPTFPKAMRQNLWDKICDGQPGAKQKLWREKFHLWLHPAIPMNSVQHALHCCTHYCVFTAIDGYCTESDYCSCANWCQGRTGTLYLRSLSSVPALMAGEAT